ncbi:MAG: Ku protein [Kibdelosporangium sp.]
MPRAIWSGTISFGLVSIPVELYSATSDHTVHFNQFQRGTADRVRYKRVNERTGDEVEFGDIVKGKEVGDGEFVLVEPDELADIAPGRSRSIEIGSFVDLDEIDPIFFQKTYWLAPAKQEYAKPYGLLAKAMAATNRAGIATFVMRGKQYLTAIRARDKVIALETLYFADEIRDPAEVTEPAPVNAKGKELKMAESLIESMTDKWNPADFKDTYTERVNKLIEDKHQGNEIVIEAEPAAATEVTDLMDALSRSVEATRGKGRGGAAGRKSAAGGAAKTADLSKADLDRKARELDIRGRSRMSRAELAKAVAKAS